MINDLLQIQEGKETTRGTPVTPTVKRMGIETFEITPIVESIAHKSQRASLAPAYEADLAKVECEVQEEGDLSAEEAPYLLDALFSVATPSGTGPYTRDYSAPLGSESSPRIKTVVKGQGSNTYKASGLLMDEFTLTFAKNEALKYSAHYVGHSASGGTLEALSDRAVNYFMAQHIALYIDAWGGTIGSTQFTDAWFSGELNVNTNRQNHFGIGALTPKGAAERAWEATLSLTLEFATASKAYFDDIIAASSVLQKQIRIKATRGTNILQFDFAGFTPEAPVAFTDEDGIVTVELEFSGQYHSTLANFLKAQSVNGVEDVDA
jgi:hypothetical protein